MIKFIRLRWVDHVTKMEEGRSVFKIVAGKPTAKRLVGKPRRTEEGNIKIDLKEICVDR